VEVLLVEGDLWFEEAVDGWFPALEAAGVETEDSESVLGLAMLGAAMLGPAVLGPAVCG